MPRKTSSHTPATAERALMDEANIWLIRCREGRADPDELALWLQSSPDHAEAYHRAGLVYGALAGPAAKVVDRQKAMTRRQVGGSMLALAAGVWLGRDLPVNLTSIVTATGETRDIPLPDGSHAFLNTNSALSFNYDGPERRVHLKRGEAWFDVRRNPDRPFLVRARDAQVRVLGTQFSVRRLDDGGIDVGVAEGQVAVRRGGRSTILGLGRRVIAAGDRFAESAVAPSHLALWRTGWIALEQTTFGAAIDELARYHDGAVFLFGDELRNRAFSGRLNIRDTNRALALAVQAASARMIDMPGGMRIIF